MIKKLILNRYRFLTVFALSLSIPLFQNCDGSITKDKSNIFVGASGNLSDGLTNEVVNYAPEVHCVLTGTNPGSENQTLTFTTGGSQLDGNLTVDHSLSIDCTRSSDDKTASSNLFHEISIDGSAFQPMRNGNFAISNNTLSVGVHPVILRVTDEENLPKILPANIVIACSDSESAPQFSGNPISINQSKLNVYNFQVNPDAISNCPDCQFSWDFNGDGVFDPFGFVANGSVALWTSATSVQNHSNLVNHRKVKLRARNACYKVSTFTALISNNVLQTTHAPSFTQDISINQIPNTYEYIQASISPTENSPAEANSLDEQRRTADFLGTRDPDNRRTSFNCNFDNGTFSISQSKRYQDNTPLNNG